MSRTLAEWLSYQEGVNPRSIELGLERVREVWRRMGAPAPARWIVTVGGTNGKGSTVAMLEAMLRAAGRRVGCYTSPHLLRYNERIRIDGQDAGDQALVDSFERIEAARGDIPLTYFEFGTLAALDLFARADLDAAVLEVGLGGRLDAINIVDADVAVITTVDLDHMDWLGNDRDSIGREKAGIARQGRPAIVGEAAPPAGLLEALAAIGARVERAGVDFRVERHAQGWTWRHGDGTAFELPDPSLAAPVQYANAAAAIAALHAHSAHAPIPSAALAAAAAEGVKTAAVAARLQALGGDPALIVDVGHNPQAARALAEWLDAHPGGRVHAVYGALADKDVGGVIAALGARIGHWHLAGLERDTPRGLPAEALRKELQQALPSAAFDLHADVGSALAAARAAALPGERILAFGSFFVAAAVLQN
ncbi:bifunctional tetrahydrofolate synthase/dihydrofolate synthase [Dyella sp. LX-66]|uniref:bifunctional tetrahydrofolate synthase/dihydrofolate synthase n=1 Tax=unclassified Dyella TaxID=2634549 RepID=UPI001BDF8ED1|nr:MULTISPECIES: bifunctional tetrahydrofolate synthase/dihydrofolate synthase [unclassified Dyella]MBT2116833.1 bifunctional tetrahydrofolate synthase/dihydrofolate synthase [Dyella sp. LX-1]MBT2138987.1 bifunctional tetrahydrofolate synthase/dihydrofolate synthase [Dyella sp. LX-66]